MIGTRRALLRATWPPADWWSIAGQTCCIAYQPIGAPSYRESLQNVVSPGTYDAYDLADGTTEPLWMRAGWEFDGVTRNTRLLFTHPISGSVARTMIVRYKADQVRPSTGAGVLGLNYNTGSTNRTYYTLTDENAVRVLNGNRVWGGGVTTDNVVAVTMPAGGYTADVLLYRDGALQSPTATVSSAANETAGPTGAIGSDTAGATTYWFDGLIMAIAVYLGELVEAEVQAVTSRMQELRP